MVCPACFSTALNGPYAASHISTRRLVAVMECSHCHSFFDPYERFGSNRSAGAAAPAA